MRKSQPLLRNRLQGRIVLRRIAVLNHDAVERVPCIHVLQRRPYYRMNRVVPLGANTVQYLRVPDQPRRLRERTLAVGAPEIREVVMRELNK